MTGKRIESFTLTVGWKGAIPKIMLDVFMELDLFYDKMEAERIEKEAKAKNNHGSK